MGAVEPGGRRRLAADGAEQDHFQDVPLEVGHAYVPTDNNNGTISQRVRVVTLLHIRIESNRLHIDCRSILW
jgi:hypothetical protein